MKPAITHKGRLLAFFVLQWNHEAPDSLQKIREITAF